MATDERTNPNESPPTKPMRQQNRDRNKRQNIGWVIGTAALFIFTKGKTLLALLGKFAGPLLTMLASIGAYAIVFPWGFSVGLVMMLLIHELGHVVAAKRKGLPVSAPVFIPFIGALINMKRHPRDAETEAYIAIGGPLFGTIGATVVFFIGLYFRQDWGQVAELLLVIANVGFFLNLINLLPIHPLDGGRIATAVTRWLWVAGLIGGLFVIIYLKSILFFVVWSLFTWDLFQKYIRKSKEPMQVLEGKIQLPIDTVDHLVDFLPGERHQSDLPFRTYSQLADGQQKLTVWWHLLGVQETFVLPQQGLVKQVRIDRVEREPKENPQHLILKVNIGYIPFQAENYYEVPAATRWKYGMAYGGLAVFLGVMMYGVHLLGIHL